jgi:hypothetical protein
MLDLLVPPGYEFVPIPVHPEGGFVPADLEPGSIDTRLRGYQISVFLE